MHYVMCMTCLLICSRYFVGCNSTTICDWCSFQHLQTLFVKIVNKLHSTVKNLLFILKSGSSFYKRLLV